MLLRNLALAAALTLGLCTAASAHTAKPDIPTGVVTLKGGQPSVHRAEAAADCRKFRGERAQDCIQARVMALQLGGLFRMLNGESTHPDHKRGHAPSF